MMSGILGFCTILAGFMLSTKVSWSFLIIMVGFFMGYTAGAEYQKVHDSREKQ
jgi:hypothetical protein